MGWILDGVCWHGSDLPRTHGKAKPGGNPSRQMRETQKHGDTRLTMDIETRSILLVLVVQFSLGPHHRYNSPGSNHNAPTGPCWRHAAKKGFFASSAAMTSPSMDRPAPLFPSLVSVPLHPRSPVLHSALPSRSGLSSVCQSLVSSPNLDSDKLFTVVPI